MNNVINLEKVREFKQYDAKVKEGVIIVLPRVCHDRERSVFYSCAYTVGAAGHRPDELVVFGNSVETAEEALADAAAMADGIATIIRRDGILDHYLDRGGEIKCLSIPGLGVFRTEPETLEEEENIVLNQEIDALTGLSLRYRNGYNCIVYYYDAVLSEIKRQA
jgi:hypothetical protein